MIIRQRAQEDAVDHREDGGVGADAQRKRQHRAKREGRRPAKDANPEAHIVDQRTKPLVPAPAAPGARRDVAAFLSQGRHIAKCAHRFRPRGLGGPPLGDERLGPHLDVVGDFQPDVVVHRLLAGKRQRVPRLPAPHAMAPVGRASSARVIADT